MKEISHASAVPAPEVRGSVVQATKGSTYQLPLLRSPDHVIRPTGEEKKRDAFTS